MTIKGGTMKPVTLVEVIKEFQIIKCNSENPPNWNEFYRQQSKNFKDVLVTLDILDAVSYLKNENGHYSFDEKDMSFLVQVLIDYTDINFQNMRKNHFINVTDEYIVWVVEGFIKIISRKIIEKDIKNQIILKMYKRTDYPLRKRQNIILQMHHKLEEIVNYVFEPKLFNFMTVNDNYTWITAMEQDFRAFIHRWEDLYNRMGEARSEEINDIAWDAAEQMTEEEKEESNIEFTIIGQLLHELKRNIEYQNLSARRKELEDFKKGFIKDKEKEFTQISLRMKEIYDEIYIKIRREILPSAILLKPFEQLHINEFETMIDSEELLIKVIQESKDEVEKQKIQEKIKKLDIDNNPQIDFEQLRKDVSNICLLGKVE
jgi:hypothetical protein